MVMVETHTAMSHNFNTSDSCSENIDHLVTMTPVDRWDGFTSEQSPLQADVLEAGKTGKCMDLTSTRVRL